MIRVVIAEDQALVLGALAALLDLESDMSIVATAADGRQALDAMARQSAEAPVDILVTDIEMPELGGLDLAEAVRRDFPATQVVIVTTFGRAGYLRRALETGVRGYLLKDTPADQLAEAVRRVASGERVIAPELALNAWDGKNPLNPRQREILSLAGEGLSNRAIGQKLHLAEGTVRNYLSEAIGELGVENRIEAYRLSRQQGWL